MAPQISTRARQMPPSPIRKLMPLAVSARRRGIDVFALNIGQPDLETPEPMLARLGTFADKTFAYTPSEGTEAYLDFLQEYYRSIGYELTRNQIVGTTGGSEAILFALCATTNPGDDVLVVEPFYTNYRSFATMAGVRLVALTSSGEDGFHLPGPAAWDAALTPKTKAVILCNPNNPTGTVYAKDELERLAAFCAKHDLFLIADEVYREFVYDGRHARSALGLEEIADHVVVVDSLSKRYSACGIRIGCLVTRNEAVWQAALRMAQGRLSAPGLAQWVALGARELGSGYFQSVVNEYQRRRDLLYEGLRAIPGVFLRKPEGAFYTVTRLPVDDADDFARWMLQEFEHEGRTVMMAPAGGFYATPGLGKDEVRIAYVLKRANLESAIEVLAAGLEAYPGRRES